MLDVTFTPLLVDHGPGCTSLGYKFFNVVYISDVKRIPQATRELIASHNSPCQSTTSFPSPPSIELFIVDALLKQKSISSHFNLEEAMNEIRYFQPKQSLLIGMSHDFYYQQVNQELHSLAATESLDVKMAYDGMKVAITTTSPSPLRTTDSQSTPAEPSNY